MAETDAETRHDVVLVGIDGSSAAQAAVRGQDARALVGASQAAELLVIMRRRHRFPFGHLGGTGRAVLRETRCPTVVLPPVADRVDLPPVQSRLG